MRTFRRTPLLLVLALTACEGDGDDRPSNMHDHLTSARTFEVAAAESTATLHAELQRGDKVEAADVSLTVAGGRFTVHAVDDHLRIDGLTLGFDDVALPVSLFPGELVLTDLHVHLAAPLVVPARWSHDGELGIGLGPGTLRLDWSLAVDGAIYPLSSQAMADLDFTVVAADVAERATFGLGLTADGVMWTWADLVALGDLDLDIIAR